MRIKGWTPPTPCPSLKPCNHHHPHPHPHPFALARSYSSLRVGCRNSPFTELKSSSLSRSLQKIRLSVNWAAQFLTSATHATASQPNLSVDERTDYCACEAWHHSRALGLLWSDLPYHGALFVANRQVWQLAEDGGKKNRSKTGNLQGANQLNLGLSCINAFILDVRTNWNKLHSLSGQR